jgi:hypothetical protein
MKVFFKILLWLFVALAVFWLLGTLLLMINGDIHKGK